MPTLRLRLPIAAGVLALILGACGQDDPTPPQHPGSPAAAPERQVITPEMDAKVAGRKLPRRDTPLAVGMVAPELPEMQNGSAAIVVFYRGHW